MVVELGTQRICNTFCRPLNVSARAQAQHAVAPMFLVIVFPLKSQTVTVTSFLSSLSVSLFLCSVHFYHMYLVFEASKASTMEKNHSKAEDSFKGC